MQLETVTEIFSVSKFYFEWYQRGFTEWGMRQPLLTLSLAESLFVLFCTQEDSDPPNHIRNLNVFKEATKTSSRESPADECIWFFMYFLPNYASKTFIWLLLDNTLRGVLWFTQVIIAELFNFIHIERQQYKSLTEKYLKKLTEMDLITYRILL